MANLSLLKMAGFHAPITGWFSAPADTDAVIYELSNAGIQSIAYTDTEHYLVTRGFLSNPARTLLELFREDGDD